MHLVGKCQEEIDSRMNNLDNIIDRHVNCNSIQTVLDWGGGEGRFVPTSLRSKSVTVLDYSTEELADPKFLRPVTFRKGVTPWLLFRQLG